MGATSDWTTIGWQRVKLQVPPEWVLAGIGGDAEQGYLRLDGSQGPRVEVKWFDASKRKSIDLNATLERYFRDLRKLARKQKLNLEIEREVKLVSKREKGRRDLECFAWRADRQAYGVIWYCPKCARVTIAQVTGGLREKGFRQLARQVLLSLEDHSSGGWDVWGAYDFLCEVPSDFSLKGQQLMTGLLQLSFERGCSTLTFSRYGLAEVVLKEEPLEEWCRYQQRKTWDAFRLEAEETEEHGHLAVTFRGPKRKLRERLRRAVRKGLGKPYPFILEARVWHCPPTNKIFIVEQVRDEAEESLLDVLCARVVCH
ncbi:MAG TPA: hypothetical protein EYP85_13370 [Armatimonadetes bacterium]|nr:hypothetical protein [Armatimonadota bacterium]